MTLATLYCVMVGAEVMMDSISADRTVALSYLIDATLKSPHGADIYVAKLTVEREDTSQG